VAICEQDLPDGSWKHLLAELSQCQPPPVLVVSSRSADDSLWAEVLNLGGCDVLAKPFDAKEVVWAVQHGLERLEDSARHTQPAQSALVDPALPRRTAFDPAVPVPYTE